MSEFISAAEASRYFSHVPRSVREDGTTCAVAAHGKPMAKIVPIADEPDRALREAALKKTQERWASQPLRNGGHWTQDEACHD